jgi:RHS repeat-associated protein
MSRLSMFRLLRPLACALVFGLAAAAAVAATTTIGIGLDTDNNPATGCVLTTANGSVPGIDQVASTVVATTVNGATVTRLERQVCSAGVLGAPTVYDNGGWNVGLGNGTSGSAVVETSIPLSMLPPSGTMKAVVVTSNGTGGQDATGTFAITVLPAGGPVVPIMVPLTPWLVPGIALLLLATTFWLRRRYPDQTGFMVVLAVFAVSGLVWAATVIRDGNVGDWNGVAPAITDASGDAPVNADVVAVFYQQDGSNLYLRIDADIRKDAPGNQAPQVNAGLNQTITLPAGATLNGSATDDGLPNPPGTLTYGWAKFSGPGTVTFGNASSAATTATFSQAGTYVLRLTVSDSALSGSADVTIVVNPVGATNQAPVVNAGPNQTITLPAGATLSGSATDDGLPNPPALLTYAWTKFSGPGTVTFGNAASAATTATFSQAGTYALKLTVSDSALSGSANVTIIANQPGATNQPPVVSAGANQTVTLPAPATLAGTATDDGLPNPPGTLATSWSLVSGPVSGVVFGNAAAPGTSATFAAPGTYVLRLTADDGALSASNTVQITVIDGAPVLAAVVDRTIELGTRFQLVLEARDGNGYDTLTYALTAAPAGASLNPAPLIDWTPTAAQLGPHTFTAKVTDSSGNAATTTFSVTVVHTNHAPQLGPQASLTMPVGTAFARTLTASDPDAGDVLGFTLVSGPAGMTLTGAALNWSTSGRNPGDYLVTVKVSDAAGLSDQKSFTVTLSPAAPGPVAKDDSYSVKVSRTLTVSAPGVLANDVYAGANPLTATRLTNPGLGTLNAFNADGGFTYQAPATVPGTPLTMAREWNTSSGGSDRYHELVADLNGDGYPDVVSFDNNGGIRARSGLDGVQLWSADKTGATDCRLNSGAGSMDSRVLADIDDSGHPSLAQTTLCDRTDPTGSAWDDSILALDHLGKVKWVSPPLSKPHPDIRRGATPVPPGGFTPGGLARGRGLSVARLSAGGPPVLLMRAEIPHDDGLTFYVDAAGVGHYAGCRAVTGLVADENVACRATFIISGTDGSVLQTLVVRNPAAVANFGGPSALQQMPPIAMDIDGDGRVDLVSGTEVWMQNASGGFDFAWQLTNSVNDTAVADLDGDGKAEIIHIRSTGSSEDLRGIFIYSFDGQLKRRIPVQTYWFTPLTIADVDGDGRSDIVLGGDGTVYAFRDDGRPIWAYQVPQDAPDNPVFAPFYVQPTPGLTISNAAPQVYDLDGDGVAEVVIAAYSRIMVLDGRTGRRKLNPFWTYNFSYNDISGLMLIDVNNDGHVDIVQNASFLFNCGFVGADFETECEHLVGPIALSGGGSNNWLPGPKAFPHVQYRSTAIDSHSRVLHDTKVSRIFRVPEQQGTVRDPRLAQATSFTYSASDGTASSAPATVFIDIVPDNQPPVFTSTPPKSLLQAFAPTPPGGLVTNYYDVTAFDPDPGDTVTFSLKSAPAWVSMSGPAQIRFEPTCGSFGNPCPWGWTTVIVTATDSRGASTDQIFIVNLTTTAVTVPNVVGMLFEAAKNTLIAQDLQGVLWVEAFDLHPAGTVLAQDAVAGAVVARFDDIRLTVSKGPQPVVMPFVIGQQLAAANALLTGAGLRVNVSTTFSNTIPAGEVMAQTPVAGTLLLPATAPPVDLTVSAGGPLPAPIASIALEPGPGPALRLAGDELQYKAVAILTDGTSADITLTAAWASSLTGVATINTVGVAKAIAAGATTISANLGGKTGQGTLNVASRASGDNTPPTAEITSPVDGGAVTGPTLVVGTASDANFLRYELAIALAGDENYTVIAEGTTAVANGTLGTLDPAMLVNDLYTLRLTVFDKGENESVATRTVQVKGDQKVGLFTLTYQDLNLPAAGIPLTVHRTYDSRDKAKGDFGIGWRIGLQTLRLRANRVLGTGWVRTVAGPLVSLVPTSEHKVSLTLSGGRVEEFDMIVSPTSNIGSLDFTNVTGFQPRAGTLGQLQALGNNSLLIVNGGAEDELVDDSTLDTYSPNLYLYTTSDGTKIEISPTDGVKKVTDPNGNAVTFGPGGIQHSDGTGIIFTRDVKNRIVAITDALGNAQTYGYDANGDLVTHTNAVGGVSHFAYDRNHGLIDIHNALGARVTRNDYDASGRLIAITDADGKKITFDLDAAAQQEIVTDRLGNVNQVLYDANGNVLSTHQGVTIEGVLVAAVTTKTYDGQNNVTSIVDPDGRRTNSTYSAELQLTEVVDPTGLNLSSAFAYNAHKDVTSATDPGGRAFTFAYDANGNVTSLSTPLAGGATSVANAQGLPVQNRDALGNTTAMTRDAAGRVTREDVVDAGSVLLRRVDFTYDANGNKTSATLYRTIGAVLTPLTTQYTYDVANRLVAVTDPLGDVVRTEYDVNDRITARIDALGRRTTYSYDTLSRLARTTYPDGTFETATYDAEGNAVATTDRAGRTTSFTYDELKRQVRATLADGSSTQTIYSRGGRIAATIDAKGNRTDYAYDTAGRRISTTLPPVTNGTAGPPLVRPQVSTALNALGVPLSATDANGHVTTFLYDASGRLIKTTYPGGSTMLQSYDVLGRRTGVTNEEGQTATFGYDGLGRLISVAGLAGDATYAYDEAGNLVSQTDALGRSMRFRYDALNRMIEKTYPGGETEQHAYDAVGNLVAHTDGFGRTTTLTYDAMNRLTAKALPGAVTIAYSYKPDGQRATVTDPRGVTTFGYDSVGRLASVTHPGGETVSYARDANGNLLSLASPAATVNYAYDALDRLLQVNSPEGQSSAFYDLAGNRVRQTSANGVVTEASFDTRDRPTALTHKSAGNAVLQSYAQLYSPAGRRSQVTEHDGSIETYTYDAKGRLSAEIRTGSDPFNITHGYDAVGNRTQMVRGGASTMFTYDSNDRLLTDGTSTYSYDANGNLASRTNGSVVTQYGYDAENRLVTVLGGGLTNQYTYDADGNRVLANTASGLTRFLVDGENATGLAQVVEERNGGGGLIARFSYGNELMAMARGGSPSFQLRDAHGSVRGLADATGTITDRYAYDAYGNAVAASGSTVNPYRYSGERLDSDTGLYQLRARYYNPALGRFISRDPFSGRVEAPVSRHRYLYADADPVNRMDPTGRESLAELSFVQGLQATLNTSYGVQVAAQFCSVVTQADQIKAMLWATDVLVGVSIFAVPAYAAIQVFREGNFKGTVTVPYESPELDAPGLKKFSMGLKVAGKKLSLAFGFNFHGLPDIPIVFGLLPHFEGPTIALGEEIKKEFKYCGHGPTLASLGLKGELELEGYGIGVEASLLRGAVKFNYPVVKFSFPPEFKIEWGGGSE